MSTAFNELKTQAEALNWLRVRLDERQQAATSIDEFDTVQRDRTALFTLETLLPSLALYPTEVLVLALAIEIGFNRNDITCEQHMIIIDQLEMVQHAIRMCALKHVLLKHNTDAEGIITADDVPEPLKEFVSWVLGGMK